jgi:hypothetical protein
MSNSQLFRFVVLTPSTYSVSRLFIFTWPHSDTHPSRKDSSGRGIGPSQRPLPDNTNTVQETNFMPPVRFEPTIPASPRPKTYALDRAVAGIGTQSVVSLFIYGEAANLVWLCHFVNTNILWTTKIQISQDLQFD